MSRITEEAAKYAEMLDFLGARGWFRNCTTCMDWDSEKDQCARHDAKPPADVIVKGCEDHSDLIPF